MVGNKGNGDSKSPIFNFFLVQAGNSINSSGAGILSNHQEVGKITKAMLHNYIDSLPQPRLKNLMDIIYNLAFESRTTRVDAAAWLGITRRQFDYNYENLNIDQGIIKSLDFKKEVEE